MERRFLTQVTLVAWILQLNLLFFRTYARSYLMEKISRPDSAGNYSSSSVSIVANHKYVSIFNDYFVTAIPYDASSDYADGASVYIYKYNKISNEWNEMQVLYPIDNGEYCGGEYLYCSMFENYLIIGCHGTEKEYIYKLNETNKTFNLLSSFSFGITSVDITDGYAIIGDAETYNYGRAHIIVRNNSNNEEAETWSYHQTVVADDYEGYDWAGRSVSISYDYAIVGSHHDDNDNGGNSGSAYIYKRNASTTEWEQIVKLEASDGANEHQFGVGVSIDSVYGFAIVGARERSGGGGSYIFQLNNDTGSWDEMAILTPKDDSSSQYFGSSVWIDGETCVVGASGTHDNTGLVYVFSLDRDTNTWQNVTYLNAFDGVTDDYFGISVGISGDYIIAAAYGEQAGYIFAGIEPSIAPTAPTTTPIGSPTQHPTTAPSNPPTILPTAVPSASPSEPPTSSPSQPPTGSPSRSPTSSPSKPPTSSPSEPPTRSPSQSPTRSPSQFPTSSPSQPPTRSPSQSPTNSLCDPTIQTNNSYLLCSFIVEFDSIFNGTIEDEDSNTVDSLKYLLHSDNYCNVSAFSDYIVCDSSNEVITHINFSNCNIGGEMTEIVIEIFLELAQQGSLEVLDLSNNNIFGSIDNWSPFGYIKNFSLANNDFEGEFDVESLTSVSHNLNVIDLSNNGFNGEIEWSAFEYLTGLTRLNLGHNEFDGEIEIIFFENCDNFVYLNVEYNYFEAMSDLEDIDEYMGDIQELYVNNNNIDEDFDVSYFSGTRDLRVLKCNNNTLRNGNLDMSDIPESLEIFDCGFNDFGELVWDALSFGDYLLRYISLKGAGIHGFLTMAFFDNENGGYPEIEYLDLSNNEDLNMSVNFEYLDGQSNIYYLNFLHTAAYGRVDFDYLVDDKNITILMSENIWCVDSSCNGEKYDYGYTRNSDSCYSQENCHGTCTCASAWTVGLEIFIESQASAAFFWLLVGVVTLLVVIGIAGKGIAMMKIVVPMGKASDTFNAMAYFVFVFQIWDFFSDLLLLEDILEHYQQASVNNPQREIFEKYLTLSAVFICVPFVTNLAFLAFWKIKLSKTEGMNEDVGGSIRSDLVSRKVAQKWLQDHAFVLVVLCVFSGSLTASLRMVNSNLFGMKYFNMGLSKFKQEETARHRLWLTIVLENVPQIFVAYGYASETVGFDNTVLAALASSILSVIMALFAAFLSFPKHYYFHKMLITLRDTHNRHVDTKLGMKNEYKRIICKGLGIDADNFGVLIENVRQISDNGHQKQITLDFVSSKAVFDKSGKSHGTSISDPSHDDSSSGASRSAAKDNMNSNINGKRDKNRVDDAVISKYKKIFDKQAQVKKKEIVKLLNACEELHLCRGVSSISFKFERYECIELKYCSPSVTSAELYHVEMFKSSDNFNVVGSRYNVSEWRDWDHETLCQWIEYKLKECISKKEIGKSNDGNMTADGSGEISSKNEDGSFIISERSEQQIEEFMQNFQEFEWAGTHLYEARKVDKSLENFKNEMELAKNLRKYWNDFIGVIELLKMSSKNISTDGSVNIMFNEA